MARFAGLAVPIVVAFVAFASQAGDGPLSGLGERISRAVHEAVSGAVAAAKEEAERADAGDVEAAPGEAVLALVGAEGTRFSGTCTIGGEESEIGGQVPARYTFDLGEDGIECEVRKTDSGGTLKVIFAAGGSRSVQSTTGSGSTITIAYDDGSFSSSTVSGGGSSSVVSSSSTR